MKKIILLLGICFFISKLYAQKLESIPLDEARESFEVQVKHFNKLFGELFTPEKLAPLLKQKEKVDLRAKWRERCAKKLISDELKQILKQIGATEGGGLWITFYVDEIGKVITVKFVMSATVYIKLSGKILKKLYNLAMAERFDSSCYSFDQSHTYAVDGFDLMKRAVEEDKK